MCIWKPGWLVDIPVAIKNFWSNHQKIQMCVSQSWLMLKLHELSNSVCVISWLMLKLHGQTVWGTSHRSAGRQTSHGSVQTGWLMLKLHELSNSVCVNSWLMLKLHGQTVWGTSHRSVQTGTGWTWPARVRAVRQNLSVVLSNTKLVKGERSVDCQIEVGILRQSRV